MIEARATAIKECATMLKELMAMKQALDGGFNQPVNWKKLQIPQYPQFIKYPMDYGTIEKKLKQEKYRTMEEWVVDMQLVLTNCQIFNPAGDYFHTMAVQLQGHFDRKLAQLEKLPVVQAFVKPPRIRKGAPMHDTTRKACQEMLRLVQEQPNANLFLEPVDWKQLGIPEYTIVIKEPMDLGTIGKFLKQQIYCNKEEFIKDMRLVFSNAQQYNADESEIWTMAKGLSQFFESQLEDVFKNDITDAERQAESNKRKRSEVTDNELRALSHEINTLTSHELKLLVAYVIDECPRSYQQRSQERFEIEIDSLTRIEYDGLNKFVSQQIHGN